MQSNNEFDLSGYKDLLTPAEVARLFRVDPKTVIRWALSGKLTEACRTLGGHRRFHKADIAAALRGEPSDTAATAGNVGAEQPATDWPRHSVGVEPVTAELRTYGDVPADATLAIVERHQGRFAKLCALDTQVGREHIEASARGYARTYGATYIPADGAR